MSAIVPSWLGPDRAYGRGRPATPIDRRPATLKEFIDEFRAACSDVEVSLADVVAKEDRVVVRSRVTAVHDDGVFMDSEPDDDEIEVHRTTIYRLEDGRIAEAWMCFDTLGLLQQIDAIPPHPQAYEWERLGSDER